MIRELFFLWMDRSERDLHIVVSKDSPVPEHLEGRVIRSLFLYEEGLKRNFYQSFVLGGRYCKDTILLTVDSKIPLFLPSRCYVIPLITDLAVFRYPETYQKSRVLLWKFQYWILKKRGDHFLAISQATKQDMISILGIPEDKIEIVPCAASGLFQTIPTQEVQQDILQKYNLTTPYFLFVGNFNPRKNLERLLLAFDEVRELGFEQKLVIVGEHGWKFDQNSALADLKHKEDVIFLGYVLDEEMPSLYRNATAFLFPTLYEGFGIPMIEAQHCGTPVLASVGSCFQEVAGELCARFVDPFDVASIRDGIVFLLEHPTQVQEMVQAGSCNASRFSWEKSAQILEDIIERL